MQTKMAVCRMEPEEAPLLAELESAAWPGPLAAPESVIRRRFALGHVMLGVRAGDTLAGAICFVETHNDPRIREQFPDSFARFSMLPRSEPVVSLYTYNLGVRPSFRGSNTVRMLLNALTDFAHRAGARWMVGDGRCPSYAGAEGDSPDRTSANLQFRATIDEWRRTGKMPEADAITLDPVLKFYHRVLHCQFLHLIPDFLPEDVASGGHRVIFGVDLRPDEK